MKPLELNFASKPKPKPKASCSVHFLLDTTSSDNVLIDEKVHQSIWKCCRKNSAFTSEALRQCISDMVRACLTHQLDTHQIHNNRLHGLTLIKRISKRAHNSDFSDTQIVALLWSCLSVLHHFHLRIVPAGSANYWNRMKQYRVACSVYDRVLSMLLPQLLHTVLKCITRFFSEAQLWQLEHYVTECIQHIFAICTDSYGVLNHLLDAVETTGSQSDAKDVLKIVQNLLSFMGWKDWYDHIMQRLLELYRRSIMNEEIDFLRWPLTSCLHVGFTAMNRKDLMKVISMMLTWITASSNVQVLQLGDMMQYAAKVNNATAYAKQLNAHVVSAVLRLACAEDKYASLVGCRLVVALLDRLDNGCRLLKTKVYLPDDEAPMKVATHAVSTDRTFVRDLNDELQSCLMTALVHHGYHDAVANTSRRALGVRVEAIETIFGAFAALVVEVPCAFTAAVAVSFAMAAQEFVRTAAHDLGEAGYRIHASVIYIISLVCYVHKATVFYKYMSRVEEFRSRLAPQLNPPIREKYETHPQFLHRTELYFEDWEARYGLHCCFQKQTTTEAIKSSKEGVFHWFSRIRNSPSTDHSSNESNISSVSRS